MKNLLIIVIFLSLLDSIKALDSITTNTYYIAKNDTKTRNNTKIIESKLKQDSKKDSKKEDLLMLKAADALQNGDAPEAIRIYNELYASSNDAYFLKQIAIANAQSGNLESALNYAKKYQDLSKDNNDVETNFIIAESLIRQNEFESAATIFEKINKESPSVQTHYILGNLYLQLNKLDLALPHIISVYEDENAKGVPLKLEVLNQLISIYLAENNFDDLFKYVNNFVANEAGLEIEKFIPLYIRFNRLDDLENSLLERFSKNSSMENLRILVATLLELKKDDKAISLLTENENLLGNEASELLMYVYANKAEYKKAYDIAKRLYDNTKDIEYLGLSAVYGFEIMPNKNKDNLTNTIDTLEYVLKEKEKKLKEENKNLGEKEAFYYNFLGYLLIDYDIDAKAGLDYVSKALALSPNSIEYLDSLAWGFYKMNDCGNAKDTFELIPKDQIESTQEIQKHYNLIIEKCGT